MILRPGLAAAVAILSLVAGAGRSQYVEDSIDVGHAWVGSLAYNSRVDVLYGASESGVFFAISCDSNKVVESFPLPGALAVDYDSTDNKAYCTFYNELADDSLLVVDGATHTRIKSLPMDGATTPVWDPVSDRLYVSCQTMNRVAVVDCASDSLLTYIPVGACPIMMYINTLRRKLYVLNNDAGTVSIVNMATNQVIKTVVVGGTPSAGYFCRRADKFYCGGPFRQCAVIGGQSDTVVARISLTGDVEVVSVTGNEDGGLVYLGTYAGSSDYVATVSVQLDSVLASTVIGRLPYGLAFYRESGLLYCAASGSDQVVVLTGDGKHVAATLAVQDYPVVFAMVPRHHRLYLGHDGSRQVYVLGDTTAGAIEERGPRLRISAPIVVTPNPFTRTVSILGSFSGSQVRVYSPAGSLIRVISPVSSDERTPRAAWDGLDSGGHPVSQGVYMIEVAGRRCKLVKAR